MIYSPLMAVSASYAHLEDEVLHLPLEDRSRLASRLLESLEEDDGFKPSPEWSDELQRRVKELDEGTVKTIPSRAVWDDINRRFGSDF